MTGGETVRVAPIDRLMANTGMSRWPTVYVHLFAAVMAFSVLCALAGGGDLETGTWPAAINDVGVPVLTLMMVELGRGAPYRDGPWLANLVTDVALAIVFYAICAVPALLVSGLSVGMLKYAVFGMPE